MDRRRLEERPWHEKTLYYKDKDPRTVLIPDNEREFARWRIGYRTLDQASEHPFHPLVRNPR